MGTPGQSLRPEGQYRGKDECFLIYFIKPISPVSGVLCLEN